MKRVGRTITPEVLRAFPRAMLASHPSRTRCDRFLEKHGLCGHFRVMYQVMSHRFPPHMRCASLSLSRGEKRRYPAWPRAAAGSPTWWPDRGRRPPRRSGTIPRVATARAAPSGVLRPATVSTRSQWRLNWFENRRQQSLNPVFLRGARSWAWREQVMLLKRHVVVTAAAFASEISRNQEREGQRPR
jgi:hypothetical protein